MDFSIVISIIIILIFGFGVWYFLYINKKKKDAMYDIVFYKVLVQRKESDLDEKREVIKDWKEYIGFMDHFFYNLHGALKKKDAYISLEYVVENNEIFFYLLCPRKMANVVEKQLTSFFPDVIIDIEDNLNIFKNNTEFSAAYLTTTKKFKYPFKTYQNLESDPLNTIVNSLSKLDYNEKCAIQIMIKPAKDSWRKKTRKLAKKIQEGKTGIELNPFKMILSFLKLFFTKTDDIKPDDDTKKADHEDNEIVKDMNEKANCKGFETIIRIISSGNDTESAENNVDNILSSFYQFDLPDGNSFTKAKYISHKTIIKDYILRRFYRSFLFHKKIILATKEVSSMFHFPHTKYNNLGSIKWQNYKITPPPHNTPKEGLLIGHNVYRGVKTPIYVNHEDRFRHFYVIGQTGTGKSSMFQSMIRQDFRNGFGVGVIDPHGSLMEDVLPFIPKERADDIVIFNPSDEERPIGLNLLEAEEDEHDLVALDAMNIMIKLFGGEVFGPRIQDYFRNGVLTLMADPDGAALTDIMRLFTDDAFQQYKVAKVKNQVVRNFWEKQMAATGDREKGEMIPYFAAKFGQFNTNSLMRNIVGQTKGLDVATLMNEGKIFLVNLSKGLIGDINSKLLGLILVSKLQTAAMRRQRMKKSEMSDFFLFIDEFQNYVTDSIESILSEARKYRLSLNIAHQYIDQLEAKEAFTGAVDLKGAIFGNVGSIMSLKIGAKDAEYMSKEMTPVFSEQDLINIDKFKAVLKLSIDTQPSRPFSFIPLNPYLEKGDPIVGDAFKQLSRLKYGRDKEFVDKEIMARMGAI